MSGNYKVKNLDIRREYPAQELKKAVIPSSAWRNGLAVRMPNHLGDAVMALPALLALKKIVPSDLALFVIAPEYQRKLFMMLPEVDGFIGLKSPHKWWSRKEFKALKNKRLGIGVMFNRSFRDAVMMRAAGLKKLYGIPGNSLRELLLTRRLKPVDKKQAQGHMTGQYLAVASALGAPPWDGKLPAFKPVGTPDENLPPIGALCGHSQMLVLCPGAAYGTAKRWPALAFRAVASDWIKRGGIVAVVGGKGERETGNEVIQGLDPDKIFNLCGETELDELFWLLKSALFIIANDSGVMHLGAATGNCGLTVFGPTDYTATGPISPNWSLLSDQPACAPCFRHDCPTDHCCMTAVTPDLVKKEIFRSLERQNIRLPQPLSETEL
ncbi:MAG: lipopolysaccharide heptosyltransferase II [Lentisphaeria bacterium]|nr:lipopolysaccharide heptosyltransferase II [Lentisphaeria bacterium]